MPRRLSIPVYAIPKHTIRFEVLHAHCPGRFLSIPTVLGWVALAGVHLTRSYEPFEATSLFDLAATTEIAATLIQRVTCLSRRSGVPLTLLGHERRIQTEGYGLTGANGELAEFDCGLRTSSGQSPFAMTARGHIEGNELFLAMDSGGATGLSSFC